MRSPRPLRSPLLIQGSQYAGATLAVTAAAAIGAIVREHVGLVDIAMLFLVAIASTAAFLGRGPSSYASVLAVAAFDIFFVSPFFSFAVDDLRHVLTFGVMLGAGFAISGLTDRIRRQTESAAQLAAEAHDAQLRAEAEEMRSSLLSSVSHDLRTPIAIILGSATTLLESDRLEAREREELTIAIRDEAGRLERLVGNVLDITRVESGGLDVKKEWIPIEELVGAAMHRLEAALADRDVHIVLPSELPMIPVDPVLFEQVLINLLDNAIKHTPAGTPVELCASAEPSGVAIEISDRGPGLGSVGPDEIFDKFVRGSTSTGGVGLGLAICRGVVAAHGGTVSAANRAGGGATFRIMLPVSQPPPMSAGDGEAHSSVAA